MSSTMMMERTGMGVPGMGFPSYGTPAVGGPTTMATGTNYMMVPRCTFKVEKCTGGMKMTCVCDDKMACSMVQNLCTMLAGGMCSCCCMMNGMTCCYVNFTCGMCRFEMTDSGFCMTCTSGDQRCCEMIQACCDCLSCCMDCGCTCCLMMNNTPVCYGCSEACKTGTTAPAAKTPAKR
jgi:hypothetical protein